MATGDGVRRCTPTARRQYASSTRSFRPEPRGALPRGGGRVDDRRRHARIARRNVQLPHVHDGLDVKSPFHSSSSR